MICGLFSSFDPGIMNGGWISSKWIFMMVLLFSLWFQVFSLMVGKDLIIKMVLETVISSIKETMSRPSSVSLILSSLFLFVFMMNIWGMLPFSFPFSSQLSVNLSISMVMWGGGIMYFCFSFFSFLSHLVPFGAPQFLLPLLVLIESVSLLIRPFTLAIRLMANIMAGHLILSLIGDFFFHISVWAYPISIFVLSPFLAFETCISVVQAYVFMSLLSLYWKESEDH